MMVTTGFFCSGQSSTDSVYIGTLDSTKNVQSQKPLANHSKVKFNTKYEYTESNGACLIIQNSFPKSAINYTDPNGRKYVYAIFWTQIINKTSNPLELAIDFPLDSVEIPSASGNYMRLLLPSDTMTIDREPLYDYGLALKSFLDNNLSKPSSLKRTVNPTDSTAFYVVTLGLSNRGAGGKSFTGMSGAIRAGLSIKQQDLFYSINGKDIPCGKINFKK